jgi:DNA-binding CsgD family transcriptional regulator
MARNQVRDNFEGPLKDTVEPGIGQEGLQASDVSDWFQVDPAPVLVVDANSATVLAANRRARRTLEPGGGFTLRGGRLVFAHFEAQACFAEALEKIASVAASEVAVVLRSDDGRWRRLQLVRGDGPPVRVAYVTVRADADRQIEIGPILEAFRLSAAEGKVLLHIAQGAPPKRIASSLGVSPHTVRAHLRSLYVKMHVRSMHELIREYTRLTA